MKTVPILLLAGLFLLLPHRAIAAADKVAKNSTLSPRLPRAIDLGPAPSEQNHHVVLGLRLRNREALEAFLADVQDPASPNYQRFLTQDEFNRLYAPPEEEEQAVVDYLVENGFAVTERFSNRLTVGAVGDGHAIRRAFGVKLHAVRYKNAPHFAALQEPALPASLAGGVVGIVGLDDLEEMRPHTRTLGATTAPSAIIGSRCCHLGPGDLSAFYDNATGFDGTGQTVVIAGAFAWKDSDNSAFSLKWGLPPFAAGSGQVCTGPSPKSKGCRFKGNDSIEVALDAEYVHATAPGAAILNYMAASTSIADFSTAYNRIVTDNPGHVVTTSWGTCEMDLSPASQQTDDNIFANANAIGQSWFAASGDNGSDDCGDGGTSVDNPANSPHVIGVGGTTPTCSAGMTLLDPTCAGYGSETAWDGSGGGVSTLFARPSFQKNCGVPAGAMRLVPDVALEADPSPGNYVLSKGKWFSIGGTSIAAPQWAGYIAELNQKKGGSGLGNPGAALYGLCGTAAFHDITTGSNGAFSAHTGYDVVTGLGTINAANFLAQ